MYEQTVKVLIGFDKQHSTIAILLTSWSFSRAKSYGKKHKLPRSGWPAAAPTTDDVINDQICIIGKFEYLWNKKSITKRNAQFNSTLKSLLNERLFGMTYFSGHIHFNFSFKRSHSFDFSLGNMKFWPRSGAVHVFMQKTLRNAAVLPFILSWHRSKYVSFRDNCISWNKFIFNSKCVFCRFLGGLEERRLDSSGGNRHLTRIRIFLDPEVFLSGLKCFPVHTKRKNPYSLPIFTGCVWTEAVSGSWKEKVAD